MKSKSRANLFLRMVASAARHRYDSIKHLCMGHGLHISLQVVIIMACFCSAGSVFKFSCRMRPHFSDTSCNACHLGQTRRTCPALETLGAAALESSGPLLRIPWAPPEGNTIRELHQMSPTSHVELHYRGTPDCVVFVREVRHNVGLEHLEPAHRAYRSTFGRGHRPAACIVLDVTGWGGNNFMVLGENVHQQVSRLFVKIFSRSKRRTLHETLHV